MVDNGRHRAAHAPQMVAISSRSNNGVPSSVAISHRMGLSFVCGYEGGLAPVVIHADNSILRCIVGILVQNISMNMSSDDICSMYRAVLHLYGLGDQHDRVLGVEHFTPVTAA